MAMPPSAETPFRLWPYLLAYAGAAVWIDLTDIHRHLSSDSIIFVLASLYEWTPFFWEQDRIGLLVPLLVSWVRNPFANLLVQNWVMIFAGLAAPLVLARLVFPHRLAPAAVTAGSAAFLLAAPEILHENTLVVCCYPLGLTLGTAALVVLDSPGRWSARLAGAVVLMLLAHWVYVGVCVFLVPLAVARAWVERSVARDVRWWQAAVRPFRDPRTTAALAATGFAVAVVYAMMEHVRAAEPYVYATPSHSLPVRFWWWAAYGFWTVLKWQPGFWWWSGVVVGPVAAALAAGLLIDRAAVGRAAIRTAPLLFAAVIELGFLSSRSWPHQNNCHPRYLIAILTAVWVAVVLIGLVPALGAIVRGRYGTILVGGVAVGLLIAAATTRYGCPSLAGVRDNLDSRFGWATEDVLATGCDGIGGEYVSTWPLVFHANMVLHERGKDRVIVGVAFRCSPWKYRWEVGRCRSPRLFTPTDQAYRFRQWARYYGLELIDPPERRSHGVIFTGRPIAESD
jgi:hypothetical protein